MSSAPFVQTVLGPIDPAAVGKTLAHEHLFTDWEWARGAAPRLNSIKVLPEIIEKVARAEALGITTIVDCSPEQFAGPPLLMYAAAKAIKAHVVAATGIFNADALPVPGWAYPPATEQDIAEHFVTTARDGLEGSGIRPGLIKVATSGNAIGQIEETILKAAGIAQARVGLPIFTHTEMSRFGDQQIEILLDAGATADRIVIGHIGWGTNAADRDYHLSLAARGATLGFDTMGQTDRTLEDWVAMITSVIEAGYGDRIVVSHDTCVYAGGLAELWEDEWLNGDLTFASGKVIPALREAGAGDEVLDAILIDTPRRILTIDPAVYPEAEEVFLSDGERVGV